MASLKQPPIGGESMTVYVLVEGYAADDQNDVGVFSALLLAQQAADEAVAWEEGDDVIGESRFRVWGGINAAGDNLPLWIYEYEMDRVYG